LIWNISLIDMWVNSRIETSRRVIISTRLIR
jgi:hypothetical protein